MRIGKEGLNLKYHQISWEFHFSLLVSSAWNQNWASALTESTPEEVKGLLTLRIKEIACVCSLFSVLCTAAPKQFHSHKGSYNGTTEKHP